MDDSIWNELNVSPAREQAEAALNEMAGILRAFCLALRQKGFTDQESLALVSQYMISLVKK